MKASRNDLVLSVNAGSSSLKISLYQLVPPSHLEAPGAPRPGKRPHEPVKLLLTSSISNISSPPAKFSFKLASKDSDEGGQKNADVKEQEIDSISNHASAFSHFLSHLEQHAQIEKKRIAHICHRVVHGGDYLEPVVITDETYHHIEELSDLAPLHNGSALSVIKSCIEVLPSASSIAFFDTTFHRSIPPHVSSYAINQTVANEKGLKKYGFHGLSYAYILRTVAAYLQKPKSSLNLILLHLGSGSSVCAVRSGKSLDTSMGLTPLSGLPGATRSGTVDPSLIFHYSNANTAGRISHEENKGVNLHVTQAEHILNFQSGWKSLTGTTDFGLITQRAFAVKQSQNGNAEDAKYTLAFDLFFDRIISFIGAYHLKLGGRVDALVFAGGIGERSSELRTAVGERVGCLGYNPLDLGKNASAAVDAVEGSVVEIDLREGDEKLKENERRILVCRTDEQFEMARQCALEDKFWHE